MKLKKDYNRMKRMRVNKELCWRKCLKLLQQRKMKESQYFLMNLTKKNLNKFKNRIVRKITMISSLLYRNLWLSSKLCRFLQQTKLTKKVIIAH